MKKCKQLEEEVFQFVVQRLQHIGLQKSVCEIYGYLFVQSEPISMEYITQELGLSLGSVSQGLKTLKHFNAVRTVYIAGQRRDFFVIETDFRKLLFRYLQEQILPSVTEAETELDEMLKTKSFEKTVDEEHLVERIEVLKRLSSRASKAFPIISSVLK